MSDMHGKPMQEPPKKSWWLSFPGFITIIFLVAIGYYLITEHRAHIFNMLPLFILLLCPLMHLFHGGHGGHNHHHKKSDTDRSDKRG